MSNKEIKVPNIGEFKDVEVIEILISSGQKILANDPLITIESDKSSVEIPATIEGTVKSVNIKVGDKVSEGDIILILENSKETKEQPKIKKEEGMPEIKKEKEVKKSLKKISINKNIFGISAASPKTRKFARELGVDINQISGSQRQGRVIESDVKDYISSKINTSIEKKESLTKKIKSEFSHSDFGEVEVKEIPRVKKLASTYLINSWTTIPHVTNHDEADITEMEEFRRSLTDLYTGEKKKNYSTCIYSQSLSYIFKKISKF
tara:strand:+ start:347 stop:1138 length:792 start_codon:yes stop_codon:yes gene_type:complete